MSLYTDNHQSSQSSPCPQSTPSPPPQPYTSPLTPSQTPRKPSKPQTQPAPAKPHTLSLLNPVLPSPRQANHPKAAAIQSSTPSKYPCSTTLPSTLVRRFGTPTASGKCMAAIMPPIICNHADGGGMAVGGMGGREEGEDGRGVADYENAFYGAD